MLGFSYLFSFLFFFFLSDISFLYVFAGLEHIVDVTVFLVDMKDYNHFNEVYKHNKSR